MSTPTRQIPKVGLLEKLGFASFSTAGNVVFNFKDLFYLFFLTNVMGIGIARAGIITAIGTVVIKLDHNGLWVKYEFTEE